MNITILAVGKLKDRFFEEGCAEYARRLGRYCALTVREAADEKAPENLSPAQELQVKEKEGKRLLAMLDFFFSIYERCVIPHMQMITYTMHVLMTYTLAPVGTC